MASCYLSLYVFCDCRCPKPLFFLASRRLLYWCPACFLPTYTLSLLLSVLCGVRSFARSASPSLPIVSSCSHVVLFSVFSPLVLLFCSISSFRTSRWSYLLDFSSRFSVYPFLRYVFGCCCSSYRLLLLHCYFHYAVWSSLLGHSYLRLVCLSSLSSCSRLVLLCLSLSLLGPLPSRSSSRPSLFFRT